VLSEIYSFSPYKNNRGFLKLKTGNLGYFDNFHRSIALENLSKIREVHIDQYIPSPYRWNAEDWVEGDLRETVEGFDDYNVNTIGLPSVKTTKFWLDNYRYIDVNAIHDGKTLLDIILSNNIREYGDDFRILYHNYIISILKLLLSHPHSRYKIDFTSKSNSRSILYWAALHNYELVIEFLLTQKVQPNLDINFVSRQGHTSLTRSLRTRDSYDYRHIPKHKKGDVVKTILRLYKNYEKEPIDANIIIEPRSWSNILLTMAVRIEDLELVEMILKYPYFKEPVNLVVKTGRNFRNSSHQTVYDYFYIIFIGRNKAFLPETTPNYERLKKILDMLKID